MRVGLCLILTINMKGFGINWETHLWVCFWGHIQRRLNNGITIFQGGYFPMGSPCTKRPDEKTVFPFFFLSLLMLFSVTIRYQVLHPFNSDSISAFLQWAFRPLVLYWCCWGNQFYMLISYQVLSLSSMQKAIVGLLGPGVWANLISALLW